MNEKESQYKKTWIKLKEIIEEAMIKKEKIGRRKAERKKLKQSRTEIAQQKKIKIHIVHKNGKKINREKYTIERKKEGIFRRQAEKMEGERRGKKEWKENVSRKD